MSFLAPFFLVGLAALAIPVLIHLIQRERKQVVAFPSLMFVRRIPYQSVRRRHIRHWALLALRLAALALIVAAFARPLLQHGGAAAAATGAREVVILLDQSYSMGFGDRWERARAAARDAVNALGPADRGTLVLFSTRADVALRSTGDRDRLLAALSAAAPGAGSTRYAPALQAAGSILADSSLPRREAILISDFQRVGSRGSERGRLPDGATLTPVAIGTAADATNLTVTAVSLARSTFAGQERVAVTAGLLNRGRRAAPKVPVTLEVDGRPVQTEHVGVEPDGSMSVTFAPVLIGAAATRGTVRLPADALERDNTFHFVVSPTAPIRVILVDRDGSHDGASLYTSRALAIGDAPRFDVVRRTAGAVGEEDLRRSLVVIVNDVAVSPMLAERLGRFVERGGGLFVALGPRATWPGASALLPAVPSASVDRSRGEAARMGTIEFGHPIFEVFRAPRSGDFASARFFGYRAITPAHVEKARNDAASEVLARFDTGAPALMERMVGRGRVLVWASTLDLAWNDLPLKPVFLPFLHRVVRHLSAYTEPAPWLTVGQVFDGSMGGSRSAPQEPRLALTPSGRRVTLDDEGDAVLELDEQGFYEIRQQTAKGDAIVIASNVDVAESDLTALDARELAAAAVGRAATGAGGAAAALPQTLEAQERAQRLWWYLLSAGLLLLGAESLLAARITSRGGRL